MKAIIYTQYGPPEVLHLAEIEKPTARENELLIKVHATTVNYGDIIARNMGNLPMNQFNMLLPLLIPSKLFFGVSKPRNPILGNEFAGEVATVGKAVKKFKLGDKVFGYRGMVMGTYAEYLCMTENGTVSLKPNTMSWEEAATIPYGAIMATSLLQKANIRTGQHVLINGASGGIGSMAVQLAKYFGAEVTGVCATPRADYVKALGADHIIDYTREDFTQNSKTYDLIFDVLGKSEFSQCENSLKPNGVLFYVSFKIKPLFHMLRTSLRDGKKVRCTLASEKADNLDFIRELIEAGKIKTIIDKTFPLEQTAAAHRFVETGKPKGKVVIRMNHTG